MTLVVAGGADDPPLAAAAAAAAARGVCLGDDGGGVDGKATTGGGEGAPTLQDRCEALVRGGGQDGEPLSARDVARRVRREFPSMTRSECYAAAQRAANQRR